MKAARAAGRRQGPQEGGEGRTKEAPKAARRRRRQRDGVIGTFNPSAHQGEGRTGFRRRLEPLDGGEAA